MLLRKEEKVQITSKTEYSIRALCELVFASEPLSLRKISEAQKLPVKYLEHLFRNLKSHDIVNSIPGPKGGYVLSKDADKISLFNIIKSVEETEQYVDCEKRENSEYCIGKPCGFHRVWSEINTHMEEYYSSITLENICKKIKEI